MKRNKRNEVLLIGRIVSEFEFSHSHHGTNFYSANIGIPRLSKNTDTIPLLVPEHLVRVEEPREGKQVQVYGEYRSLNKRIDGKNRLILYVFAKKIEKCGFEQENRVLLDGFVCKPPIYRTTPFGREIADILIAVNRRNWRSDYIPCIAWGRNARFSKELTVGDRIQLSGRIQSREYQKKISDNEAETRTAYEVSIQRMEEIQ